ncbi:hypothetical protein [Pseudobutyrivibrio xylanivorans]|uniref:hypothetical protein n=1 Tax=Pseudobutyrivibrio xylanivorans TaxID=185007 RepID=UPI00142EB4FC|nr:hypothetical protein [Pseudobutyrivibrio xylanivorans]
MNTANMLINVAAILAGLMIYIFISNTKWGKDHEQFQYAIMLMAIMAAVLLGGLARWLI